MGKRKISMLMTFVMVASLFFVLGSNVYATESSGSSNGAAIWKMEEEIEKQFSEVCNETYEFQEDAMSRLYQLKVEALGEKYFPQYGQKQVQNVARLSLTSNDTLELGAVVYSETKQVSDEEALTYTEYASGRASLAYQQWWQSTSTSPSPMGEQNTCLLV